MKRLDHDKLPCKFANHYWEQLGEKWMGSCEMFECTYDGEKRISPACYEDNSCAAYQPIKTFICEKHDEEYTDICWSCENENDQRMYEADKEYRVLMDESKRGN